MIGKIYIIYMKYHLMCDFTISHYFFYENDLL